jgi:hypothetical protein
MGLLSDLKSRYHNGKFSKLINDTNKTSEILRSEIEKLGITESEISQTKFMALKQELFTAYTKRREADYQNFLTAVGYNNSDDDLVHAEMKKFANWRQTLRAISAEKFGRIRDVNSSIKKLHAKNRNMLKTEKDESRLRELKLNMESLEGILAVSDTISAQLEEISKEVEGDMAESEDATARNFMRAA